MRSQIRLDLPPCVHGAAVPQPHHRSSQMLQPGMEDAPDIQPVEGPVGGQAEGASQVAVPGRDREGAESRELVVLEPMVELRRVPLRSPGPFDGRGEREATLVEEDEVGAQSFSLFFYGARRPVASRRWPARCAGGHAVPASGSSSRAPAAPPRWRGEDRTRSSAAESRRRSAAWSTGPSRPPRSGAPATARAPGSASGAGTAWEGDPESVSGRGSWALPAERRRPTGRPNSASTRAARPRPTGSGPSCAARGRVGDAAPADWGCQGVSWLLAERTGSRISIVFTLLNK